MNIPAYIIYLLITFFITVVVGFSFYRNGRVFILAILRNDEKLTDFINRLLLLGYYLLNLGYAALMLRQWRTVTSFTEMMETIVSMTGRIIWILAIIHFLNMLSIYLYGRYSTAFNHQKHIS